jgi:uncharacterized protein YraI
VPSAWGSGTFGFDIGSGSAIYNPGSGNQTQILNNSYNNGTNFIFKNTSAAARYRMIGAAHEWYSADSDTAGNAISFTQAMTLGTNSGLSIGTTTAAAANGLLVAGAATFSSSVTTGGDVNIPNGNYYYAKRSTGGANIGVLGFASGSDTLTIKGGTSGGSNSINFEDTGGIIASFYNGIFGIGTTSPFYKLEVIGGIYGQGLTADSDGGVGTALWAYNQVLGGSSTNALINLATTWNTTGNADAIVLDVTNTASGASSRLLDLKVGGSSIFKVQRNGRINASSLPTSATGLSAGDIWNDGGTLKIV